MSVLGASITGLFFSFAIIGLLRPSFPAPWRWALQGVTLHSALWFLLYASLVVLLGRPWFAMAISLAFLMLLVQVNNAKVHSLREAFVFQDFEYFTDAILHPRLYIPFLGWWKFAAILVAVALALGVGLWLEEAPEDRFLISAQLGEALILLCAGVVLLLSAKKGGGLLFLPEEDIRQLGFIAALWRYAQAEKLPVTLPPDLLCDVTSLSAEQPDFLVVQSESFFDPRQLLAGIHPSVLAEFDRLSADAACHGQLQVPAWGANTVRSEFAFLSGSTEAMLGVHRFNPYRKILNAEVVTLASVLKKAGYRTVCVHPYPASFYGRDKVYPHLGFDEFIDIRSFDEEERFGPYISDRALGEKVKSLMQSANGPTFIFAITMENHGPLHLEKAFPQDVTSLFSVPPPDGCDDLVVYLRHLKNADRMIGDLSKFLTMHPRPARLCWYGDHVPIMPSVYRALGSPDGLTNYLIWNNRITHKVQSKTLALHDLGSYLLAGGS